MWIPGTFVIFVLLFLAATSAAPLRRETKYVLGKPRMLPGIQKKKPVFKHPVLVQKEPTGPVVPVDVKLDKIMENQDVAYENLQVVYDNIILYLKDFNDVLDDLFQIRLPNWKTRYNTLLQKVDDVRKLVEQIPGPKGQNIPG